LLVIVSSQTGQSLASRREVDQPLQARRVGRSRPPLKGVKHRLGLAGQPDGPDTDVIAPPGIE